MDEKKRYADTYEIIYSFKIGRTEVVIGEDQKKTENPYIVANYEDNGIIGRYFDVVGSEDYAEIVAIYSTRITIEATKVRDENEVKIAGYDSTLIGLDGCDKTTWEDDICNKIIVIKPTSLKREFRTPLHQLKVVTGGFGASAKSRSQSIFCKDLFTGKDTRYDRTDVLGTIEKDNLPMWAKTFIKENEKKIEIKKSPTSRVER